MNENKKIFAGNSVPVLAEKIASELNLNLGKINVSKFSDGEILVSIPESVKNTDCYIIQSTCPPVNDNLMELLIAIDALKRESAFKITAVIPYFGYARQDRQAHAGEPITAKLAANLITCAGANEIITLDLHSPQIQGFFDVPVRNLTGSFVFVDYIKNMKGFNPENFAVAAPDAGSVSKAHFLSERLGCELIVAGKNRAKANVCEIISLSGDINSKNVILFDDMIDTAGTVCECIKAFRRRGCLDIFICASHAVLSGRALERLAESDIKKAIFLDTVSLTEKIDNFEILSSSKIFSECIFKTNK
jgi:ribose-phosphate pyrophosphokinase